MVKRNEKKVPRTKMSPNGQVVIPGKIREQTGLKPGNTFLVSIDGDNIVLTPQAQTGLKEATAQVDNTDGNESERSEL